MNGLDLDNLELGWNPATCLMAENATLAISRERHLRYVGGHALTIRWGRMLAGGRVP